MNFVKTRQFLTIPTINMANRVGLEKLSTFFIFTVSIGNCLATVSKKLVVIFMDLSKAFSSDASK